MRAQMGATIESLMAVDPRLAVVLADISAGYFEGAASRHPGRVVNVGIMEQTAVSLAAGLALEGFIPVVHSIAPFVVERPFEQIKDDFCYQGLGGNFISIGASYDYGTDGMTHYGMGDVPILRILPGMEIVVPGTAAEFDALFRERYADGCTDHYRLARAGTRPTGRCASVGWRSCAAGRRRWSWPWGRCSTACSRRRRGSTSASSTARPSPRSTAPPCGRSPQRRRRAPSSSSSRTTRARSCPTSSPRSRPQAVRVAAVGVPRRVLSSYGTAADHDSEVGLDVEGIRRRVLAFLAAA